MEPDPPGCDAEPGRELPRARVPTGKIVDSPWKKVAVKLIDPVRALDMDSKWTQDFESAVIKRLQR